MRSFKNRKSFLSVILIAGFLFTSYIANGQTYANEADDSQEIAKTNQLSRASFLSTFGLSTSTRTLDSNQSGNSIFLTQIGELNKISIGVKAEASEINLSQNGNKNFTQLNYNVNTVFAEIAQNGNNNSVFDFINNPSSDIALELQQNGDNLNFERQGANALTESLRFIQTEASPNLIIRSNN